ncbi:MAG: hypothetical protein AVDCRST_MAG83-3661, partial [uncultured Arthrobacter sp.]
GWGPGGRDVPGGRRNPVPARSKAARPVLSRGPLPGRQRLRLEPLHLAGLRGARVLPPRIRAHRGGSADRRGVSSRCSRERPAPGHRAGHRGGRGLLRGPAGNRHGRIAAAPRTPAGAPQLCPLDPPLPGLAPAGPDRSGGLWTGAFRARLEGGRAKRGHRRRAAAHGRNALGPSGRRMVGHLPGRGPAAGPGTLPGNGVRVRVRQRPAPGPPCPILLPPPDPGPHRLPHPGDGLPTRRRRRLRPRRGLPGHHFRRTAGGAVGAQPPLLARVQPRRGRGSGPGLPGAVL